MKRFGLAAALIAAIVLPLAFGFFAGVRSVRPTDGLHVSVGALTNIPVFQPDGDPAGLVILVSAKGDARRAEAMKAALLKDAMIVLPVDLDAWRAHLDAETGTCIYLGSDLENIAKETLRHIGDETYRHPVVVGIGEAGTLAYAALADAPAATLAGAVALDPAPILKTRLPTCPGKAVISPVPGGFAYSLEADLPAPGVLIVKEGAGASIAAQAGVNRPTIEVEPNDAARLSKALNAVTAIAADDTRAAALPVIDMPARGQPRAVAVFFSGDGGWRDLDKSIGDWLAAKGVHVVGVDSLRYFWRERTPKEIADDTVSILEAADPAGDLPVMVLGYSFGANTFPFAWPELPKTLRDRIKLVGLLGTEQTTRFQVSVGGWLGLGGDRDVAPAIARIPTGKVVCVHGSDEDITACSDPRLAAVSKIELSGGHHFDGDYDRLAARLLAEFDRRLGPES